MSDAGTLIQDQMDGQPALEAKELTLSWEHTEVVHKVSLKLFVGELVCIIGRSGCGKTTLLHALAGLTQPTAGRVVVQVWS